MKKDYHKAEFSEVFRYGFGGVGSNIPFMLTMMYLMYFYTDHLGINAAAVGGLFLVSRLVDAITDPIMGMIADRTSTKWGRFRPWIMFAGPALGLSVITLFTAPNLSDTGKVVYVYITYILYSLVSTVANIPYHSLTPVLSEDPDQRTVIATVKQAMGTLGSVFVTIGAIPITTALGGDARAWQIYGIICGIIIAVAFLVCAWGAKEHDTMVVHNQYDRHEESVSIKEQLQLIYKNKALLMLMIAFGTDLMAVAAASAVEVYYFIYAVQRPDLIQVVAMFGLLIGFPVTFFVPYLSKRLGKKRLFMIASAVLIFISGSLVFIPFTAINMIVAQSALMAAISPFTVVVGWAMLADCVEYGEWVTGKRGAGTVSSQMTFVNKLGMAMGGFLAGIALSAAGYVAGGEQTQETLRTIVSLKALIPALGYLASVISMSFYPITNEFYGNMVATNEEKRELRMEL